MANTTINGMPEKAVLDGTENMEIQDAAGAQQSWRATAAAFAALIPTGNTVAVEDEGVSVVAAASTLNFIGAGVAATDAGGGVVDVTIPGGGGGGYFILRLFAKEVGTTIIINSAAYVLKSPYLFPFDYATFPFTQFRIYTSANSTEVGQSVILQLCLAGTPAVPISAAGNDLVVNVSGAVPYDSGWVNVNTAPVGFQRLALAFKGSNGTVDIDMDMLDIMFK